MSLPPPLIQGPRRPATGEAGIGVAALTLIPQMVFPSNPDVGQLCLLDTGVLYQFGDNTWSPVAGQSGSTAAQVAYTNPAYPSFATVKDALDDLLYVAPTANMSGSVSQLEIGATLTTLLLSWSYNKAVVSQSIDQGVGTLSPSLRSLLLSGLHIQTNTTWNLTGSDGTNSAHASASVSFLNRRFWGVDAATTPDAGLFTRLSNEFATNRNQSRSLAPTAQYLYFAWPQSFGEPTFTVNGLLNNAWIETDLPYTNAQGYVSTYAVFRSQFPTTSAGLAVVVS